MLNYNYEMKKDTRQDINVVVIGGGTGSFTVLTGLKDYVKHITALVSMADDGGSTGQLRDELGVLPPGDVRQCLVALSESPKVRELFNYRFDEGGLSGHSFGNLFLTALEKTTGSFVEAVNTAGEVLDINGHRVLPTTLDKITLVADDGEKEIRHEREIRETSFTRQRPRLWLEPSPEPNPAALNAIAEADLIVIAPGGLYESLGAALTVPGIGAALAGSKAKKIYICNLMNQAKHTDGFTVTDYADELERLAGVNFIDEVIYNTQIPSDALLGRYALERERPVEMPKENEARHYRMRGVDLLSRIMWKNNSSSDQLAAQRALIRHDSERLAQYILGGFEVRPDEVHQVQTLYVIDMDRTLIKTSLLFDCLCESANKFQDHLGDELRRDYQNYLMARDTDFRDFDFVSDNHYVKMRLAGKNATFDPTSALNRILSKRLSSATSQDVYSSMAEQLQEDDKYEEFLLPGAEKILRFVNEKADAEMAILTYGEHAFQDAKFAAVLAPLFRKMQIRPRYLATPDRHKANWFMQHMVRGGFKIDGLYGLEDIQSAEVVQIGDERDDIIGFEKMKNYRAYCIKSPIDQSKRKWPTEEELARNHCRLFTNFDDIIKAENE